MLHGKYVHVIKGSRAMWQVLGGINVLVLLSCAQCVSGQHSVMPGLKYLVE